MHPGKPIVMAANATANLPGTATGVARFIAKTAGTLTLKDVNNVSIIDAVPVAAGTVYEYYVSVRADPVNKYYAASVVLAGGASGTLVYV